MYTLTGQEKMQLAPIDGYESCTSPKVQAYTSMHVFVAFETRGNKILVIEKDGKLTLPVEEITLRQRNMFDVPTSVIKKHLRVSPSQIRDEHHRFPLRVLGGVAIEQSLYMFLKVPIILVNQPGWHYINDKDLPARGDQVEPAFFVLADKLWDYAPVTA